jgi:hypothetical protein
MDWQSHFRRLLNIPLQQIVQFILDFMIRGCANHFPRYGQSNPVSYMFRNSSIPNSLRAFLIRNTQVTLDVSPNNT